MTPEFEPEMKKRPWLLIGILGAVVVTGGVLAFTLTGGETKPKPKRKAAPEMVSIVMPPPPPPPKIEPPKPEPPKEQPKEEMIEQEPIAAEEPPPSEEAPPDSPPDLGTNIVGDGPNAFGLKAGGGNGLPGGGGGNRIGGRGGSRFGNSALKIQSALDQAMRQNGKIRSAVFSGKASVWIDRTGRVTRAKGNTNNPVVNAEIASDFTGRQLPEAPPADMPMPVQLRVSGRKP